MRTLLLILMIGYMQRSNAMVQLAKDTILSLDEVINSLSPHSPAAQIEKLNYKNVLLQFDNYKKSFLPTIALSLNPLNFNRSLRVLQNSESGSYSSVEDYSNNSTIGLSIKQRIGFTGGDLTVGSNLNYLNEFSLLRNSVSVTPFNINYSQSMWGGNKLYRLERDIECKKNLVSVKEYCIAISDIQQRALLLFMNAFTQKINKEISLNNKIATDTLLIIGKIKKENGSITEYEYNQIELQWANNQYEFQKSTKDYDESCKSLLSFLGSEQAYATLEVPLFNLPTMLDRNTVIAYIQKNNPFVLKQDIRRLEAENTLFLAKLNHGFNGSINLSYGLNQYSETFIGAYRNPNSRQSITIGVQIPIYQWGINKNKYQIAKNNYQSTLISIDKDSQEFEDYVERMVNNYNYNVHLWFLSERAFNLSQEQYRIVVQKFSLGKISIYELVTMQKEQATAIQRYYNAVRDVWDNYFTLQKMALYDFIKQEEIIYTLTEVDHEKK